MKILMKEWIIEGFSESFESFFRIYPECVWNDLGWFLKYIRQAYKQNMKWNTSSVIRVKKCLKVLLWFMWGGWSYVPSLSYYSTFPFKILPMPLPLRLFMPLRQEDTINPKYYVQCTYIYTYRLVIVMECNHIIGPK